MAFGKGRENDTPTTSRAIPAPSSSAASPGGLTAFIDQGSEFEGKLSFKDTVRIDGRFRGEISSENTLIVGETGEIEASISSSCVVVSGAVVGDISAKHKVVLHKTARVQGDMNTPSLIVEEGATFNGRLTMERADAKGKPASPLKAIDGGEKLNSPEPQGN